jgi:hypothetical protein
VATYGVENTHRRSPLLNFIYISDDPGSNAKPGRSAERLNEPPNHELGDGACACDNEGTKDEKREEREVDRLASI